MQMITYANIQLSEKDIYDYLIQNENIFMPPLLGRLNLKEYSKKLQRYAAHFCAFDDNQLVGFIACYFNNTNKTTGFISSVSVIREFHERGIFSVLFSMVRNYGISKGFCNLQLNANSVNHSAITIYEKIGFVEVSRYTQSILMEMVL